MPYTHFAGLYTPTERFTSSWVWTLPWTLFSHTCRTHAHTHSTHVPYMPALTCLYTHWFTAHYSFIHSCVTIASPTHMACIPLPHLTPPCPIPPLPATPLPHTTVRLVREHALQHSLAWTLDISFLRASARQNTGTYAFKDALPNHRTPHTSSPTTSPCGQDARTHRGTPPGQGLPSHDSRRPFPWYQFPGVAPFFLPLPYALTLAPRALPYRHYTAFACRATLRTRAF